MPVRPPTFDPPFNVVRASHVEFGVRDLARSREFYVDCLGLLVSAETEDALYLRGVEERNHHSIVLHRSRAPEARALGFKVASEDDLDRAASWFRRRNLPTAFPELPHQGRTLRTADIFGTPIDLYAQMEHSPSMLQKYAAHQGARIQRIDHLNCFTPDVQASYDFYSELGFRLTEYSETDGDDPKLWAVWLHRKGNVHDLAFTNGAGPRLHHVGVWTAGVLDIIHICDVMATCGYLANMERGPGRHGISNAFFLYVRDPDGHRVELFTSDYLTVDPDHAPIRWSLTDPQRQTLWGQPAPASWFEQGASLRSRRSRLWRGNRSPSPACGGYSDIRKSRPCGNSSLKRPKTPSSPSARSARTLIRASYSSFQIPMLVRAAVTCAHDTIRGKLGP
jgi:catechol 2,3-dioxygenase